MRVSNFEVLDRFVCRIGGVNCNVQDKVGRDENLFLFTKYVNVKNELTRLTEIISSQIYAAIPGLNEKRERNLLIGFRRDIFNFKKCSELSSEKVKELVPGISNLLIKYNELNSEKEEYQKQLQGSIEQYAKDNRSEFVKNLSNQNFQKGLLISSRPLFDSQKYYIENAENRKNEQIERGLLRYYSRMAMKATPFGSFCSIIPGEISDNLNSPYTIVGNTEEKDSVSLLNKALFGCIATYIKSKQELFENFDLILNPTFRFENEKLVYLTSVDNKEVFQRLPNNPVLDLISKFFTSSSKIKYKELVNLLILDEELEAEYDEIIPYLNKLIEIGFLHINIGVPDQVVDWDILLVDILKEIDTEDSQKIRESLQFLRENLENYRKGNLEERTEIIRKMTLEVETLLTDVENKSFIKTELPLYEDSTAKCRAYLDNKMIQKPVNVLAEYISLTRKIGWPLKENISMRKFFDNYYQDQNSQIPLLQFYEDYYREHFKDHLEKQNNPNPQNKDEKEKYNFNNPFNAEAIEKISNINNAIVKLIREKWAANPEAEELNISLNELRTIFETHLQQDLYTECSSHSVFIQAVKETDNRIRFIVPSGNYLNGYGKYFSRFVRLFSEEEQKYLLETSETISEKVIAEICGDANFNANLHPPLLKNEISYPIGESGLSENTISSTNIYVERHPENENILRLIDLSSGEEIVPVDLGFLNPMMRPPLYQLLSRFTTPGNYSIPLPSHYKEVKPDDTDKEDLTKNILYCPRVVIDDEVLVARKRWIIYKNNFPFINLNEKETDYFIRLNEWRVKNNIPSEVYIKINPLPENKPVQTDQPKGEVNKEETDNSEQSHENKVQAESVLQSENSEKVENTENVETPNNATANEQKKETKKQNKFSRDFYKPQYIDFFDPLYAGLFAKLTVTLKNFMITLEERYPENGQLLTDENGNEYSSEFIFQINFPEPISTEKEFVQEVYESAK